MSEEVSDASLTVPRVMMYAVLLNGIQGFVATITLMYSVQDITSEVLDSTYAFPFIGVFAQATGSNAAAIGMTVPWCGSSPERLVASVMSLTTMAALC